MLDPRRDPPLEVGRIDDNEVLAGTAQTQGHHLPPGIGPRRVGGPYSPGTYAWWQVVTLGPGQSRAGPRRGRPCRPRGLGRGRRRARRHRGLGHADLLAPDDHDPRRRPRRGARCEQVSLGGEPVDQAVLDQLTGLFPDARVSWIYASSELGASIVVHDGRAGFPVEWLERDAPDRPRLAVEDGELVIASPHHGEGLEGAVRTGDAVVVEDGRVLITGRTSADEINVGGAKVSAGVVRSVLQSHPDVVWAHVRGRKAPLVGTMVVADVVLRSGETSAPETVVRDQPVVPGAAAGVRRPAPDQAARLDPREGDAEERCLRTPHPRPRFGEPRLRRGDVPCSGGDGRAHLRGLTWSRAGDGHRPARAGGQGGRVRAHGHPGARGTGRALPGRLALRLGRHHRRQGVPGVRQGGRGQARRRRRPGQQRGDRPGLAARAHPGRAHRADHRHQPHRPAGAHPLLAAPAAWARDVGAGWST